MLFTKMHGISNDYVYVDCLNGQHVQDPSALARAVSDRHKGIGSDGLVLIMPSEKADFRMRMFNADGTEAEMCGNASRCVGKLVYDKKHTTKKAFTLETKAGIKELTLHVGADGRVESVTVDMGAPVLDPKRIPVVSSLPQVVDQPIEALGREWHFTAVSMGNPHAVIYVPDVDALDLEKIGPVFENHPLFPQRVNTEFVQIVSPTHLKMRVWERGAGETMACGTGACATAVASVLCGAGKRRVTVSLRGGDLDIEWRKEDGHVLQTGPATTVFTGDFPWN